MPDIDDLKDDNQLQDTQSNQAEIDKPSDCLPEALSNTVVQVNS